MFSLFALLFAFALSFTFVRFFDFIKFCPSSSRQSKQYRLIKQSDLFDAAWYLTKNADVASSGMDPVRHYLVHGAREGRDPGPFFNAKAYQLLHEGVDFSAVNPLLHYLAQGKHQPVRCEQYVKRDKKSPPPRAPAHQVPESAKINKLLDQLHELRPDLERETIRQILMDDKAYWARHPDIRKIKFDPLLHYVKYGFKENRRVDPALLRGVKKYKENKGEEAKHSYIFMADAGEANASCKYRCLFPARQSGCTVLTPKWSLDQVLLHLFSCQRVTFLRPSTDNWRDMYLLTLCRNLGLDITIDYDDLLFPEFHHKKGAVRSHVLSNFFASLLEQERVSVATLWADRFTCSTPEIARWLEKLGKPVTVIPNKLPLDYFNNKKIFDNAGAGKKLRLLYSSGSATHGRDFSTMSGVLARLFQEHGGDFELTILGNSPQLKNFCKLNPEHVKVIDMLSFDEMLALYGAHDVVLVPLEKGIFNNAKSHIKYIEAASQGTPVIATPVAEFASKIKDGVNGFLCDSDEDWYQLLKKLVADKSILYDVGGAAYHQAKKEDCIHV